MSSLAFETAETMAAALLDAVGLPREPGIDLFEVARLAGVRVEFRSMRIDGRAERVHNERVVALSVRTHPRRQRFTLAHELGHVLLDDPDVAGVARPGVEKFGDVERFCNEFAAELLMPRQWVKCQFMGKRQDFVALNAFTEWAKVSNTAAVVRLGRHASWSAALLFFDRQRDWAPITLAGAPRWAKGVITSLPDTTRVVRAIDRDKGSGEKRTIMLRNRRRLLSARAEFQSADYGVFALAHFTAM
jgi:hypothetical protein